MLHNLKMEFQVLVYLIFKALLVKTGSFDARTNFFLVMAAITVGTKVNCSSLILKVLIDMISKHSTGFAVKINKILTVLGSQSLMLRI